MTPLRKCKNDINYEVCDNDNEQGRSILWREWEIGGSKKRIQRKGEMKGRELRNLKGMSKHQHKMAA